MSEDWPFGVEQDKRFEKLFSQLVSLDIITFQEGDQACVTSLVDAEKLLEAFSCIFVLYAFPLTPHKPPVSRDTSKGTTAAPPSSSSDAQRPLVSFCKEANRLVAAGDCVSLSYTDTLSDEAGTVLDSLVTAEGDGVYEYAFNALLAVYLACTAPLKFIYPNTYVRDLGQHSHELDICLGTPDQRCVIVETTRGFNKSADEIDESYLWHFKKALFRKWAIEKLYELPCTLAYITVRGFDVDIVERPAESTALEEEIKKATGDQGKFVRELLQAEGKSVQVLDFDTALTEPLTVEEIGAVLQERLIDKLPGVLGVQ